MYRYTAVVRMYIPRATQVFRVFSGMEPVMKILDEAVQPVSMTARKRLLFFVSGVRQKAFLLCVANSLVLPHYIQNTHARTQTNTQATAWGGQEWDEGAKSKDESFIYKSFEKDARWRSTSENAKFDVIIIAR